MVHSKYCKNVSCYYFGLTENIYKSSVLVMAASKAIFHRWRVWGKEAWEGACPPKSICQDLERTCMIHITEKLFIYNITL